jgi:anti-sigma factor (TIGR02949 family)
MSEMNEHDCDDTKRKVHEFLQQELSEQEMQVVTEHLAHCEACEDEFDVEVALNEAIERAYLSHVNDDVTQRVLNKLRALDDA